MFISYLCLIYCVKKTTLIKTICCKKKKIRYFFTKKNISIFQIIFLLKIQLRVT